MMNQKYALQKVFLNMDDGEFLYPVSFHGRYAVDEFMYNARTHFRRLFRAQRMSEQELANWQTVIERHLGCTSKELDYGEYEWYSVEVLAYCQKNLLRTLQLYLILSRKIQKPYGGLHTISAMCRRMR